MVLILFFWQHLGFRFWPFWYIHAFNTRERRSEVLIGAPLSRPCVLVINAPGYLRGYWVGWWEATESHNPSPLGVFTMNPYLLVCQCCIYVSTILVYRTSNWNFSIVLQIHYYRWVSLRPISALRVPQPIPFSYWTAFYEVLGHLRRPHITQSNLIPRKLTRQEWHLHLLKLHFANGSFCLKFYRISSPRS